MENIKLLTLNLHCLEEEFVEQKQQLIAQTIIDMDIDVIFLQEVAQSMDEPVIEGVLKEDNYGVTLQTLLHQQNASYYLYYQPIKQAFNRYDEGIALLSKYKLNLVQIKHISKTVDYQNWKSRKVMCYQLRDHNTVVNFATTHFGWSDGYEVFEDQVNQAIVVLPTTSLSILAGDFNVTPDSKEYQHLIDVGLHDIFKGNEEYFLAPTFHNPMDVHTHPSRIDYIMTDRNVTVLDQQILFTTERVSDHFGVYAKIKIN